MRDLNIKASVAAIITPALLLSLMLLTSACSLSSGTPISKDAPQGVEVRVAVVPCLFAVFDDKSGSTKSARLQPLREQDLLALIAILRKTGGELAFGLIGESSDRPLLRLRVPVPPTLPVRRTSENAFERAEMDSAFQSETEHYEAMRRQWETDVNQRVAAFLTAARPRLSEPAKQKATDISSAIARAELFLNEPGAVWPEGAHRYIILNSDGIATTNRKTVLIKSGARLLLVNGSGSLGAIEPLQPLRFESLEAALNYIAATESGRS